jgi:EmrB/QacA subfamily drug resistance transporter
MADLATADVAPTPGKWRAMPFIALGVSMIIVDGTIVNVAIPSIIKDIGLTTTDAEWVNSIYALVFAALLLTTGRLGDIFGRRKMFLWGTVIFVLASGVAAVAPNPGVLILGRFLQGVGGALILPNSLSTVNALYQGKDRNIAFGIWGATIGGTAALGPLLGGWLTTSFSWRWAFLINLIIGPIIIYGLLKYVKDTKDPRATRGFDPTGTILSIISLGALVFALIEGQNYGWFKAKGSDLSLFGINWTWSIAPSGVAFIVAAVAAVLFIAWERYRAKANKVVLLDFTLFRIPSFSMGNVAALIVQLGEFGLLFVLPLFLSSVLGYSALKIGVVLLALAMGAFVAGPTAGQLAAKYGGRPIVRVGMVLEVIGILGIAFTVSPTTSGLALSPWLFIYGLGVGFATAQLTSVILVDVPVAESGQGSAVQSTSRQIGAALGTAVLGAVLVTSLANQAAKRFITLGLSSADADKLAHEITRAPSEVFPQLAAMPNGPQLLTAAGDAFATATKYVGIVAAGFVFLGLVATLLLPRDVGGRDHVEAHNEPGPGVEAATT